MHLIEFFDRGVQVNPHGVAFVRPDGTGTRTYVETADITHRIAAALQLAGFGPGTPVGVLSLNTTLAMPCVLGVLRSGCAWVALNSRATAAELGALLHLVGARGLIFAGELACMADDILDLAPYVEKAMRIDEEDGVDLAANEWLAPPGTVVPLPASDPESVAAYMGTGGTTGAPKAVVLPHRALETMVHGFNAHMPERSPVNLVASPMTHAAGATIFPVLSVGGTNVVHDEVDPLAVLESIEHNQVTRLFLPPTAVYALLAHPGARRCDLSSLRFLLYAAAPMSTEKLVEALDVFGPVMAQCYGQTEAPMLCTFFGPEDHLAAAASPDLRHRLASAGRPSLVASVAVVDGEGVPVERGEPGEIVVRSSLLMRGYHDDEAGTAAIRMDGGWQATGDIGRIDSDGFVYIVDRSRDLIISGGFNVFPSEIEQVIWAHPSVKDCAVVGLPDEKWGERVTAVVELKPGAELDADDLLAACRRALGPVKTPKEVIVRALPRSSVGKVLKRALRDEYWLGHERQV